MIGFTASRSTWQADLWDAASHVSELPPAEMAKRAVSDLADAEAILGMPVQTAADLLDTFADLYPGAKKAISHARKKQKKFDATEYTTQAKQIFWRIDYFDAEPTVRSLRELIKSAMAMLPVSAANALSALTKIALEAEAAQKKDRHAFAVVMHYYPAADKQHHNVGRELRDAIRAACSKCDAQALADRLTTDMSSAIQDVEDNFEGDDDELAANLDALVKEQLTQDVEHAFCSALVGDWGCGSEDDECYGSTEDDEF